VKITIINNNYYLRLSMTSRNRMRQFY